MARTINFFDGAESGTTPNIGNIVASSLVAYANDAAFEAAEQGSPTAGNIYLNTTSGLVRYYTGSAWVDVVDELSAQTIQNKTIDGTSAAGNNTVIIDAANAQYDNTTSGLSATDAQEAIDEVEARVEANEAAIAANAFDIDDLETLSGSPGAVDHGTFTGSTIPDNSTTKSALQALETEVELKLNASEKGAAGGVAELDGSGKVPASQLPSYVDDVEEYADFASLPVTGETGKIYVTVDTNKTYRWTGSVYIEVSASEVVSVNGQSGTVILDTDDVAEGSLNEYYTDAKADARADVRIAAASIDDLSDVDTTTLPPQEGQALVWESIGGKWVPGDAGSGSGAGSKTYFKDGDFENSIDIAVAYNDGGAYVDGEGGTSNVISIAETSTALAGEQSLEINKSIGDASGEGVTLLSEVIDEIDRGKDLYFSFAIDAEDANYVSGDLKIYAYDVTNSSLLSVVPITNLGDDIDILKIKSTVQGKILTEPTTAQIRLSLHLESDSAPANAWSIRLDEARIGPGARDNLFISGPIGEIIALGSSVTPENFLYCDGSAVSRSIYADLFAVIGTSYGPGDGLTTFNLPEGRGYFLRGQNDGSGNDPDAASRIGGDTVGSTQGDATALPNTAFTTNTAGNHAHTLFIAPAGGASNDAPNVGNDTGLTGESEGDSNFVSGFTNTTGNHTHSVSAGGDLETRPINVAVRYYIRYQGSANFVSNFEAELKTFKARIYHQATQTISTGANETVSLGQVDYDPFNSKSGNTIVIPRSGYYRISGQVTVPTNVNTNGRNTVSFYNGATLLGTFTAATNNIGNNSVYGSITVYLPQGAAIDMRYGNESGVSQELVDGASRTFLEVIAEPDFSTFGVYGEKNLIQTKILSANVTTDTTISDLTFNNLTVGIWYTVNLHSNLVVDDAGGDDAVELNIVHNGITIGRAALTADLNGTTSITSTTNISFKATATSLTFVTTSASAAARVVGNGNLFGTYVQLEERNDLRETDKF